MFSASSDLPSNHDLALLTEKEFDAAMALPGVWARRIRFDRGERKLRIDRLSDEVEELQGQLSERDLVHAVGASIEEAIKALAVSKKWGEIKMSDPLDDSGDSERYHWGFYFHADGTSMKAAGRKIPGGFTVTWWK